MKDPAMNQPQDELELLRRLRQLPRERTPSRDLWAAIDARIGDTPAVATTAPRNRWAWVGLAAAASLAIAIGLAPRTATQPASIATSHDAVAPVAASPAHDGGNGLARREAEAITIEYQLALASFADAPLPPELDAAATELDVSARQLREALRDQPDATYLLDQLRRTYDHRLKLAQRAMLG
jgi:hypothetical protein